MVATKGEYNLVECTHCGCRWRRSRALPVADEASDKEWQRSADSEQSEADAGNRNRRRSMDPLYERTALVEVDIGERIVSAPAEPRARAACGDKVLLGCNDKGTMLFEQRNVIY